jgi:hypothetical protein
MPTHNPAVNEPYKSTFFVSNKPANSAALDTALKSAF